MSDMDVLRRIAERGLKLAQNEVGTGRLDPRGHLDLWTHMLDEIGRACDHYGIVDDEKSEVVEIDIDDELLLSTAKEAHRQGITLNRYIMNTLMEYVNEHKGKEK